MPPRGSMKCQLYSSNEKRQNRELPREAEVFSVVHLLILTLRIRNSLSFELNTWTGEGDRCCLTPRPSFWNPRRLDPPSFFLFPPSHRTPPNLEVRSKVCLPSGSQKRSLVNNARQARNQHVQWSAFIHLFIWKAFVPWSQTSLKKICEFLSPLNAKFELNICNLLLSFMILSSFTQAKSVSRPAVPFPKFCQVMMPAMGISH